MLVLFYGYGTVALNQAQHQRLRASGANKSYLRFPTPPGCSTGCASHRRQPDHTHTTSNPRGSSECRLKEDNLAAKQPCGRQIAMKGFFPTAATHVVLLAASSSAYLLPSGGKIGNQPVREVTSRREVLAAVAAVGAGAWTSLAPLPALASGGATAGKTTSMCVTYRNPRSDTSQSTLCPSPTDTRVTICLLYTSPSPRDS